MICSFAPLVLQCRGSSLARAAQLVGTHQLNCALAATGPAFEGSLQYDLPSERQTVMQQTAASSGQRLRQLAGGEAGPAPGDAKAAAAQAALRRAGEAATPPPAAASSQQQQQWVFRRGDAVLYTQRDGTQQQAKVRRPSQGLWALCGNESMATAAALYACAHCGPPCCPCLCPTSPPFILTLPPLLPPGGGS